MINILLKTFSNFLKSALLLTGFAYMFSTANAQTSQTHVQQAMRYAITYGVDEQTHQSFWIKVPVNEKREFSENLSFLKLAQAWQYAFWESASETVRARKVIRTENYTIAFQKIQRSGGLQITLDKAEAMLESIAKGESLTFPPDIMALAGIQSNQIIMNETFTDRIRDNIGVSFDRLSVLFSEQWPPVQETFTYPTQNLKYTSSVRLAFNEADQGVEGMKIWEAIQSLGRYNILEFSVIDFSESSGVAFDHDLMLLGFDQLGIEHIHFGSGTWFGLPFEESSMSYKIDGKKMHALSKTIIDMSNERTYSVTISSEDNLIDAMHQMEMFMARLSPYN